ncbi:nicotinate-nucleotide adenylyltransferase [Thalassotalea sp. PLHSN55]|uniref:nicotinate-nucleotide adenylyltransferase n=1 Tax=Thalassotalea sp. PLHSN55 TaxID=3435888 RepID=UPI003F86BE9F
MSMPNARIGLYGGSFDPIHWGHINSAKHLANWLALDKLTLIPNRIPPHKNASNIDASHRHNMVKLVCQQESLFTVDDRELVKTSTSYTVETLAELKQEQPQSTLFFLIGMDSLQTFTTWHRWQDILQLAHIVVSTRPGYCPKNNNQEVQTLLAQYQVNQVADTKHRSAGCILLAPEKNWDISSTQLRAAVNNQSKCTDLAPKYILDYINRYKLYR